MNISRFQLSDILVFIAESTTGDQRAGNDDITTFLGPLKVHRCWRNTSFYSISHQQPTPYILYNQRIKYLASIQRGMLPTLQWLFFSLTPSDIDGSCQIWKSHDGKELDKQRD